VEREGTTAPEDPQTVGLDPGSPDEVATRSVADSDARAARRLTKDAPRSRSAARSAGRNCTQRATPGSPRRRPASCVAGEVVPGAGLEPDPDPRFTQVSGLACRIFPTAPGPSLILPRWL
jgi:hypothetical protein